MPTIVTKYARQSVTVLDVLAAYRILLSKALGWNTERVIQWHWTGRPNLDHGRSIVWYRHLSKQPDTESGALRHGSKTQLLMEVNLTTRGFSDSAQKDDRLVRTHLTSEVLLENALYDRILHDDYDDRVGSEPPQPVTTPTVAAVLSVGTMISSELPAPDKPRSEEGYMETRIGVMVPIVLSLTINEVLPLPAKFKFPKDA